MYVCFIAVIIIAAYQKHTTNNKFARNLRRIEMNNFANLPLYHNCHSIISSGKNLNLGLNYFRYRFPTTELFSDLTSGLSVSTP